MENRSEKSRLENIHPEAAIAFKNLTLRAEELEQRIKDNLPGLAYKFHERFSNGGRLVSGGANDWTEAGIECQVLEPGGQKWENRKVKLKIVLEFSDSPEKNRIDSNNTTERSLDKIRQSSNQENE